MAQDNGKELFKGMKYMIGGGIIVSVILLIIFLLNQTYRCDLPIDTGILGGVLGTVVALYSAYLLIKTFENQSTVNESVKKTNDSIISANAKADAAAQRQYYQTELQIFDGKFSRFFDAYQQAINAYEYESQSGRTAFEIIAGFFIDKDFDNNNDYKRRSTSATDEYVEFYAEHQTEMSVHLRMLYLLVNLISKSELEEDDKVQYAKLVRGQMSNAEMLIVRYNCRSHYGKKMQPYCNQYNLTKHLSLTRLLEFKSYRKTIEENREEKESGKLLSGLDVMFITLRKRATKMLYDENPSRDEYTTSHSYTINMDVSSPDKQTFVLEFKKNKEVGRRGGGIRVSPEENALDIFSECQVLNMFKDFLTELFLVSNFEQYNEGAEIRQVGTTISNVQEFKFTLRVSNTKRLVLSYIQKEKRDNPVGILE